MASVTRDAAVHTLPRDGEMRGDPEFFTGAFISIIKHQLEELDNLIIDLWRKVVSGGPSAVKDSLLHFPLGFHIKALPRACRRRDAFGSGHCWRLTP